MNHTLALVDMIFVICNRDDRIATYAAELYRRGFGDRVLVSGGNSSKNDLLKRWPSETEARHFADILTRNGVPSRSIIAETKATNTGENIRFGYELLAKKKIHPKSLLLIQKPYMERRTYATFMKQWPGDTSNVIVSSPNGSLLEYINEDQSFETVVNIMVGDLQRIIEYPKLDYQIYQKVPHNVLNAYDYLVKHNYNKHLIQH